MTDRDPPGADDDGLSDPGPDIRAGEFALGVLDGEAHRAAVAQSASDARFSAAAMAWSERLSPLLDEIAPVEPRAEVWHRIAVAVGLREATARGGDADAAGRTREAPGGLASLRRSRNGWRAAAITAMAASVALLIAAASLLTRSTAPPPARPAPLLVATLSFGEGGAPAMASYQAQNHAVLVLAPARSSPPRGSPQLWVLDRAGTPHAIGMIESGDPALLKLEPNVAAVMRAGAVLAISLEPAGGSPTGKPTGPVVAKGPLRAL